MRDQQPGFATLAEQVATGIAVYAAIVLGLDVAGLRGMLLARLRLASARMKAL